MQLHLYKKEKEQDVRRTIPARGVGVRVIGKRKLNAMEALK